MSIKITREDHQNLWIGLSAAAIFGLLGGTVGFRLTADYAAAVLGWAILPAVWLVGWFLFHLTRPEE